MCVCVRNSNNELHDGRERERDGEVGAGTEDGGLRLEQASKKETGKDVNEVVDDADAHVRVPACPRAWKPNRRVGPGRT